MSLERNKKQRIKVNSWKELEQYGKPTEKGLFIPMGVHGLSGTKILFDQDDENAFIKEVEKEARKQQRGRIVAVGILN